jgi:hypothetical protein
MAVLSYGETEVEVQGAHWREGDVWLPVEDLLPAVGWEARSEGLCAGEVCVPIPPGASWSDGTDEDRDIVAYEAPRRREGGPTTIEAPDFTLPDLDGQLHSLSDYRGQKVMLLAWASF